MAKRTITATVELTLYEPDRDEAGCITSSTLFVLLGGDTATINGEEYPYGTNGIGLAVHLPNSYAVTINVKEIIRAGLEAISDTHPSSAN